VGSNGGEQRARAGVGTPATPAQCPRSLATTRPRSPAGDDLLLVIWEPSHATSRLGRQGHPVVLAPMSGEDHATLGDVACGAPRHTLYNASVALRPTPARSQPGWLAAVSKQRRTSGIGMRELPSSRHVKRAPYRLAPNRPLRTRVSDEADTRTAGAVGGVSKSPAALSVVESLRRRNSIGWKIRSQRSRN
jgi:hypothetical protein